MRSARNIGLTCGIGQIVELLGIRLKRIKCAEMEGLVEKGKELIDGVEEGPLRDASLTYRL